MNKPEYGKTYALTGANSIASGNTWKDSEVKSEAELAAEKAYAREVARAELVDAELDADYFGF